MMKTTIQQMILPLSIPMKMATFTYASSANVIGGSTGGSGSNYGTTLKMVTTICGLPLARYHFSKKYSFLASQVLCYAKSIFIKSLSILI